MTIFWNFEMKLIFKHNDAQWFMQQIRITHEKMYGNEYVSFPEWEFGIMYVHYRRTFHEKSDFVKEIVEYHHVSKLFLSENVKNRLFCTFRL